MDFPYPLPFLLDGATATNLMAAGMPEDVCREQWILEHPDILLKLQRDFIMAGSQALYAPTFSANAVCLSQYGLQDKVEEYNTRLVALTKSVAAPAGVLVGGNLCPTGLFVPPYGKADFDDIYDIYREQVRALESADVDFLIIESQTSLADMRAAVLAARTASVPVFVTITVDESGHTLTGGSLLPTVITLQAMGVDAIGLNCSFQPAAMLEFIQEVAEHSTVPIIAKPNAGSFMGENGETLSPEEFAAQMRPLLKSGAGILGGCCGTTPEHIAALRKILSEYEPPELRGGPDCYAAAIETEVFFLWDDLTFSEPIVCSSGLGDDLIDLDDEQCNAALVEINSVDDALLLAEYGGMSRLPIAIRSENLTVLDAALRYFQGRLIIDTANMIDTELMEPFASKYGAILY